MLLQQSVLSLLPGLLPRVRLLFDWLCRLWHSLSFVRHNEYSNVAIVNENGADLSMYLLLVSVVLY